MFLNQFGKAPLLFLLVLFSFLGCRKDQLDGNDLPPISSSSSFPKFDISVSEARDYYHRHAGPGVQSVDGMDGQTFIRMEPDWALAYSSTSYNGKSMLVVPFLDRRIVTLNNGKAEAKLVFTKVSADTLTASIVIYVPDNTYHSVKNGTYSFNDFTGAYLLFGLNQKFKEGVFVKDGIPVGALDSISWTPKTGPAGDDRTINCIEISFEVSFCEYVLNGCPQTYQFTYTHCWNSPGSGGSNSGGSGGSSGGGGGGAGGATGGYSGGNVTGGTLGNGGPDQRWYTIFSGVPIGVFLQNGGVIPNTINVDIAQKLIAIHRAIKLTEDEIRWLTQFENQTQNQEYVNLLFNFLQLGQTGNDDSPARLKQAEDVLKFFMTSGIPCTPARFNQMLNNAALFQGLQSFFNDYQGLDNTNQVIQMLMDHAVANNLTGFNSADFATMGAGASPCGPCLATAVAYEYAMLKFLNCNPNPCSNWELAKLYAEATWNVLSSEVHLLLDGAGLVPGFGEIADLTNGVIYTIEGDNVNAALSFAAAVPFLGWTATGAKYARKIINVGGNPMSLVYLVRSSDGLIEFGSRSQLRTVLKTAPGWQAHHIIPWELGNNKVIQAAAKVSGNNSFHLNEIANGISLPTGFGIGNLPAHTGSHPNFTLRVKASLDEIQERIKDSATGLIDPDTAADEVRHLTSVIRDAITSYGSCPTCKIDDVTW